MAAIVAVLVIIGVFAWRSHSSSPAANPGALTPYQEYRGSPGGPYGAPAGAPR